MPAILSLNRIPHLGCLWPTSSTPGRKRSCIVAFITPFVLTLSAPLELRYETFPPPETRLAIPQSAPQEVSAVASQPLLCCYASQTPTQPMHSSSPQAQSMLSSSVECRILWTVGGTSMVMQYCGLRITQPVCTVFQLNYTPVHCTALHCTAMLCSVQHVIHGTPIVVHCYEKYSTTEEEESIYWEMCTDLEQMNSRTALSSQMP